MNLILASTSSYRRGLLQRLQIPFSCLPPDVDETALPGEAPQALVARLALACEKTGFQEVHLEPFTVYFRELADSQIENYLKREQPYDCAGSFKCEGLGIALFSSLSGDDPTALEGLPLISLVTMLTRAGINPLH